MKSPFFISLSDLHFNPCYDPALTPRLVKAPAEEWEAVFQSAGHTEPSAYGADTNYPLLTSLFEELNAHREAEFVLFSGDFLGHWLQGQFEEQTGNKDEVAFQDFVGKTITFLIDIILCILVVSNLWDIFRIIGQDFVKHKCITQINEKCWDIIRIMTVHIIQGI